MSCFSIMAAIHSSLRNSLKSQTLWLHCRVSGGQGAGPLTPEPAQGSVRVRDAAVMLLRYELSSGGVWGNKNKSWNKPKEEEHRFLGTIFTAQRLQRQSIGATIIDECRHYSWDIKTKKPAELIESGAVKVTLVQGQRRTGAGTLRHTWTQLCEWKWLRTLTTCC